ncbi:glycerol-3-phosphate dehydrogenase/oxidase [Conexibacter sp. JD483]|nr:MULTISPECIES: glycerol-3-phosphate dehydrogenase/oxidase [unclassified Conexibacter]MDO8188274.1 glycerol-3-phosphate dehydrogenase/oxidase [Conexibacter sp. CPCC 205706]MDO8197371.1 glycerol-3-phosphate dehydrogenase/oxidase [Conexibacter sp. CPCC 205762]MDR9370147.1 glycerol-3-phosphate dehydrogenase/oxidase [Conexibacter sp. JD483]
MNDPSILNPGQRDAALERMANETFEVVVIGGGVVGCSAALDAATRGLSVALVEARDFAAGTSSRSSKLIHGGLRYLEQLDFGLVREALSERRLLLTRIAPHLVKPVPFLYPLEHRVWERGYVGAGMVLYDEMAGHAGVPRHRHLTKRQALRIAPGLKSDALIGAIQYHDAKVDDARHTLTIARTAAFYGAAIANNAPVVGFLREGERVTGVRVRDVASDREIEVRGQQVINSTGVWTDDLQHLVGERGKFRVRASKGIHLVVPKDRIQLDTGLILRTEKSVLFVIPWGRHWIVGTTDTDWELHKAHPAASRTDIDYVLEHANRVLAQPLTHADVEGVYAGLRPLLSGESESTSKLSREHSVAVPVPGLVAVAGGKYTTSRIMGKDAVDAAVRGLERSVPPSSTDRTELLGADGYWALWNGRRRLARESGLHIARVEHLLNRYGSRIGDLFDLIAERPELAEPLPGADDYLQVEVVHAASHEGARHLDDVLARRTRISIETFHRGTETAPRAAELMAEVLGWSRAETSREVETYVARVEAERRSQEQPDDKAADEVRTAAPDLLAGVTADA